MTIYVHYFSIYMLILSTYIRNITVTLTKVKDKFQPSRGILKVLRDVEDQWHHPQTKKAVYKA